MNKKEKKKKRLIKLDKLKSKWDNCEKCSLNKYRTNIVWWRGHPCAKILVIGEAPGKNEDLEGIPFIGDSGKELDKMIEKADLNTKKDVFVVNTVGCRPKDNKKPTPRQMFICLPRLIRIIDIIKPKIIVLTGSIPAKNIAGIMKISEWKNLILNVELDDKKYRCIATYHPAYYLYKGRNKTIKQEIIKAFRKAKKVVNV